MRRLMGRLIVMLSMTSAVVLQSSSAVAFERSTTPDGQPLAWVINCINYSLHRDGSDDLPFERVEAEVQRAFEQWALPECSDARLMYAGATDDRRVGYFQDEPNTNIVVWREGGADRWTHDPSVIAVTTTTFCTRANQICPFAGAILDADIELNGERFTFGNDNSTQYDLGNTLTHEVGHFLGLDHSAISTATMFALAPPGELNKRDLDQDDINGVCAVFPLRMDGEECFDLRPPIVDGGVVDGGGVDGGVFDGGGEPEPRLDVDDADGSGGGCHHAPGPRGAQLWILAGLWWWRRRCGD